MSDNELLAKSSGYIKPSNRGDYHGYFDFHTANQLVATGRWHFEQSGFFGYVLKRAPQAKERP